MRRKGRGVTDSRRWWGLPRFFRAGSCKSRSEKKEPPYPLLYRHPSPQDAEAERRAELVDYAIRGLIGAAAATEAAGAAVAYLLAYGIPAPATVAERHNLVWTTEAALRRWRRRLEKQTGPYACAARAFARVWAPALRRPGLLVPIRDGGRLVSAKVFREPDEGGKRAKYILKGLSGRYLWGADEVGEADLVYIVEGEGDKMALDGSGLAGVAATVCTGGTGVAGDAVRLGRIAAWCDPLLQAARYYDGRPPRRAGVLGDQDAAGRPAAVAVAGATGAEVSLLEADPRDLIRKLSTIA